VSRLPKKTNGPIAAHLSESPSSREGLSAQASWNGDVAESGPIKLLRFPAVRERTGLSRSTIWRLEKVGDFPTHRRISANTVWWVESEVAKWIQLRIGQIAV
jgi:prophage regulatory protein